MTVPSGSAADWRTEAYGRLTAIVDELEHFRTTLRTWVAEVQAVDVAGSAAGGAVIARCTGYGELTAIEIDARFFEDATTRDLESAIGSAVRGAEQSARDELTARQSGLRIFGISVGEGLAGKSLADLLPPPAFPTSGPASPRHKDGGGG